MRDLYPVDADGQTYLEVIETIRKSLDTALDAASRLYTRLPDGRMNSKAPRFVLQRLMLSILTLRERGAL